MIEKYVWNFQTEITLPANASVIFHLDPLPQQQITITELVVWYDDAIAKDLNVYVIPNHDTYNNKIYYANAFQMSSTNTFYFSGEILVLDADRLSLQGVSLVSGAKMNISIRATLSTYGIPTHTKPAGATEISIIEGVL